MAANLDRLLFEANSLHRTPSSARFHFPSPRGSPYASNRFAPHQSALPQFYSAVPRSHTSAGNLRLLHPIGHVSPRNYTGGQSLRLSTTVESVSGKFQAPFRQGQGWPASWPASRVPRPKDTPLQKSPRGTQKATATPGSLDDAPRPHHFGLFGALPEAEQFEGVETTRWQNDAIASRRAAKADEKVRHVAAYAPH